MQHEHTPVPDRLRSVPPTCAVIPAGKAAQLYTMSGTGAQSTRRRHVAGTQTQRVQHTPSVYTESVDQADWELSVSDDVYMPTGHGTQQVHVPPLTTNTVYTRATGIYYLQSQRTKGWYRYIIWAWYGNSWHGW